MTDFFVKILGDLLILQAPEPVRAFLEVGALCVMAVASVSLAWTSWRVRQIVRKSLGRKPRLGEDTSLNSWMRSPGESLDTANRELAQVPRDWIEYPPN